MTTVRKPRMQQPGCQLPTAMLSPASHTGITVDPVDLTVVAATPATQAETPTTVLANQPSIGGPEAEKKVRRDLWARWLRFLIAGHPCSVRKLRMQRMDVQLTPITSHNTRYRFRSCRSLRACSFPCHLVHYLSSQLIQLSMATHLSV